MSKAPLKGVYKLNPTQAVMKTGSRASRRAVESSVKHPSVMKNKNISKTQKVKNK
tara:strand:- start:7249 stop:7413 length:165 start_codon:yes stop_codon:yes gene_type:complete